MKTLDITKSFGKITAIIEYKNKPMETYCFPNTVLDKGKEALISFLINQNSNKLLYVQNMLFGDGGLDEHEQKRVVMPNRNNLYGITKVKKPVVAQMDPMTKTQAIFTSVITFEEANGVYLSEMALQMNNEDLFSMATFPTLGKTEQMQITFNWSVLIL